MFCKLVEYCFGSSSRVCFAKLFQDYFVHLRHRDMTLRLSILYFLLVSGGQTQYSLDNNDFDIDQSMIDVMLIKSSD